MKRLLEIRCQKSISGGSYKNTTSYPGHHEKYNVQKKAEKREKAKEQFGLI